MPEKRYYAHESAYVDEPSEIGEGTKIWHFTHVMKDSVIGRGCNIGQNVLVASGVRIGDGCKIQNNVSLYTGVVLEERRGEHPRVWQVVASDDGAGVHDGE